MIRKQLPPADTGSPAPSVVEKMIQKRSRTLPLVVLLLLVGLGVAGYAYAEHRWHEAQTAAKDNDQLEEAQRHLDFCLMVWPRSVPVHLLAARVARLRGDLKASETHLLRCKKLNGGASEAIQLEFLLLRVQTGEVDAVAEDLMYYVDNNSPESPLILETLARVYMQNLRYGPAFVYLGRWEQVQPESPEPHRWRGWVLERMSDQNGAIREYKRALELDPDNFAVRFLLSECYLGRFDPVAAMQHLEYLHERYPDRADVLARLGELRHMQGHPKEARSLLQAASEKMPKDTTILVMLAKIEMQEEPPRFAEAEVLLRRVLELEPTYIEAENMLGKCLEGLGRAAEADAMFKQFNRDQDMLKRVNMTLRQEAERPVSDPAALCEVGKLFLRGNNDRLARYWLKRALERDESYRPALQALAEHYESKGELNEAAYYRSKLKPADKAAPSGKQKDQEQPRPSASGSRTAP
jgi:tetratricopeptide (TPR) repeat protein